MGLFSRAAPIAQNVSLSSPPAGHVCGSSQAGFAPVSISSDNGQYIGPAQQQADWLRRLVAIRLDQDRHSPDNSWRVLDHYYCGFDRLEVHKTSTGYSIFVVVGGEAVLLEDNDLFPSDNLITKLRVLRAANPKKNGVD